MSPSQGCSNFVTLSHPIQYFVALAPVLGLFPIVVAVASPLVFSIRLALVAVAGCVFVLSRIE